MPHTRDGLLVNVGDVLYLPCKVKSVQTGEEFCNVDVETLYPMPPYDHPSNFSALNTKQFVSRIDVSMIERVSEGEILG